MKHWLLFFGRTNVIVVRSGTRRCQKSPYPGEGAGLFIRGRCHSRLQEISSQRIDAQPAFGVGLSALVGFGQSREVLLVETPVTGADISQ